MRSQHVQLPLHPLALLHRQLTTARSKHDGRPFMAYLVHLVSLVHLVCLVDLVCFDYLVDLAHLVSFV
jgi:hypothetical protein